MADLWPNLFHIGSQKAGSTYLYNMLASHPDASLSPLTEVNFFTNNFGKGHQWYKDSFQGDGARIDTSPKYFMLAGEAAPRIKDYCDKYLDKEPKFLLILRNPIDYLNSHYQMQKIQLAGKEREKASLADYLDKHPGYLKRARYHELLAIWWRFFEKSQFKIICFEEFIENTREAVDEIMDFYGLRSMELKAAPASKNKNLRARWVWHLRKKAIRNEFLKNRLKKSRIFSWAYDNFLTIKSDSLPAEDRKKIKFMLMKDIEALKGHFPGRFNKWKDF